MRDIKIEKVETILVSVPRTSLTLKTASNKGILGQKPRGDILFVKIQTDVGVTGMGEARSTPTFIGETTWSIKFAIQEYLGHVLIGQNPFDLEKIHLLMDSVLTGNVVAKSGIDLALYDIIGKSLGVTVGDLLGGRYREKIPVAWELGSERPDEMASRAVGYVKRGIRILKLKLGFDLKEDVERTKAVRNAIGDDVTLRVDANQGWSRSKAVNFIRETEGCNLELVEQPVPRWDIDGLAKVKRAVDVPIEADESVWSPNDAIQIIKRGAADIINIKICKAGGLYNARKIATIADAAGITCLVGSMCELGIGVASKLHLAASAKNMKHACEFTEFLLYKDYLIEKPFKIENGYLKVPNAPGLGIKIDSNKVKLYSCDRLCTKTG